MCGGHAAVRENKRFASPLRVEVAWGDVGVAGIAVGPAALTGEATLNATRLSRTSVDPPAGREGSEAAG
jgi:hypothetical protein